MKIVFQTFYKSQNKQVGLNLSSLFCHRKIGIHVNLLLIYDLLSCSLNNISYHVSSFYFCFVRKKSFTMLNDF